VPIEAVRDEWAKMVHAARTRLLAIPAKCAARVGMATTTAEAPAILKEEIYDALNEFARGSKGRHDGTGDPAAA